MAHYDQSLFGFVTLGQDEVRLEGREANWVPPTPEERGVPDAAHFVPQVRNRRIVLDAALPSP